jgi:hypothetical protein
MGNSIGIVQALFNDESSSDVRLLVDETSFYCHKAVLQHACQYHQFLQWPNRGDRVASRPELKIDLPDIEIPDPFRGKSEAKSKATWFEIFLKVMYDAHALEKERVDEVFALSQIADYLISPAVTELCDNVLSSISFSTENVLPTLLFCQRYSLPRSLQKSKNFAGDALGHFRNDPLLYEINIANFKDIALQYDGDRYWQFYIILCYAARAFPRNNVIPVGGRIRDPEMMRLCKEILPVVSTTWSPAQLNNIYETFCKLRSGGTGPFICGDSDADKVFLFKLMADCYRRLSKTK